jgi:hypothetical protein
MSEIEANQARSLTPEGIKKLEDLKDELESLSMVMQNMQGKSKYEIEDRIRTFQNKEAEIKTFLRELGMLP